MSRDIAAPLFPLRVVSNYSKARRGLVRCHRHKPRGGGSLGAVLASASCRLPPRTEETSVTRVPERVGTGRFLASPCVHPFEMSAMPRIRVGDLGLPTDSDRPNDSPRRRRTVQDCALTRLMSRPLLSRGAEGWGTGAVGSICGSWGGCCQCAYVLCIVFKSGATRFGLDTLGWTELEAGWFDDEVPDE